MLGAALALAGLGLAGDFAGWQAGIFSRAGDFIASYRILSQSEKEGYLTLTVKAEVYLDKLRRAVREAAASSKPGPTRPAEVLA